ncbi:DNA-directed RNA polymerase [Trypanosoma conorhini]|uniref:DNA-directed RNA polymerase n=1 Tax=Trypanosoma conorhini TaxID=83891 RepID=A0A422PLJ4_9TRYP|nr:DNA-directed RNA polymerase [Trypanosoma conorhini]RNF18553.1 DNA-directed RNA polymerase [Trypanosoma conorhini]
MRFGVREHRGAAEEEDEVVATYNVYASPLLQHQLHIFQFPMRRKMRPYEADDVQLFATEGVANFGKAAALTSAAAAATPSASILSPSSRLTMHCRLDMFGSSSFVEPSPQPQPMQQTGDGLRKGDQPQRHSYHYALQSHPFQPRCDYAVGFIVDGAIHLTPVSTIQQFTPIVKPTTLSAAHCVGEGFTSVPSMPIVPGLAISDRIHREMLRQRSVMLNTDAATAKELQYFPIGSVESMAMRRRLWSPTYEVSSFLQTTGSQRPRTQTEDSLFPPELLISGGISGGEDAAAVGNLLRRYAHRYGVLDQVLVLLQRCQVLTLAELRALVLPPDHALVPSPSASRQPQPDGVTDKQLLEALREAAVWIHGVWVSKTASRFKGTVAALREVVLLLFFESADASLARAELNKIVNSTALQRNVKEILESVATLNSDEPDPKQRVWRLRHVPADAALRVAMLRAAQNAYPQEVTFQRMQWEKFRPYIMGHINAINLGMPVSRLLLATRRNEAGAEATNLTGMAVAAAAAGAASSSFKDDELAPILAYIRRLFLEHGVLNKQRAKELVMKGRQQHYPDATNPMLSAALQRCVQTFTNATWVLKVLGEPKVDRYRPLILETAVELVNFETRAFHALLEEKRQRRSAGEGEDASGGAVDGEELQRIVSRVLSEVAVYKQHERLWHLKSGNAMME